MVLEKLPAEDVSWMYCDLYLANTTDSRSYHTTGKRHPNADAWCECTTKLITRIWRVLLQK